MLEIGQKNYAFRSIRSIRRSYSRSKFSPPVNDVSMLSSSSYMKKSSNDFSSVRDWSGVQGPVPYGWPGGRNKCLLYLLGVLAFPDKTFLIGGFVIYW